MPNMCATPVVYPPSFELPPVCSRRNKTRPRMPFIPLAITFSIALLVTLVNLSTVTFQQLTAIAPVDSKVSAQSLVLETPPPNLPLCKRVMVLTGARQGSTWFVDSIEGCKYSAMGDKENGVLYESAVFKKTELWKHFGEAEHGGEVLDVDDVLKYVEANGSIKIFPSVFWRRKADVTELIRRRAEVGMTVMILRRDVEAAWNSWVKADAGGGWNGATGDGQDVERNESQHQYFVESRGRYDRGVDQLLRSLELEVDAFDYDDVKERMYIVAEKSGCYVRNCNFEAKVSEDDAGGEDPNDPPE